jgi:hypothetical protein
MATRRISRRRRRRPFWSKPRRSRPNGPGRSRGTDRRTQSVLAPPASPGDVQPTGRVWRRIGCLSAVSPLRRRKSLYRGLTT